MKIKLNKDFGQTVKKREGYLLKGDVKYLIDYREERDTQTAIMSSISIMGPPQGLKDYHEWLKRNNTNESKLSLKLLERHYGKKPSMETTYSQGLVMKDAMGKYFIVLDCSRENPGYKYSQIIIFMS